MHFLPLAIGYGLLSIQVQPFLVYIGISGKRNQHLPFVYELKKKKVKCIFAVVNYLLSDFLTKYAKPSFLITCIYCPGNKTFVLNSFGGQTPEEEESC